MTEENKKPEDINKPEEAKKDAAPEAKVETKPEEAKKEAAPEAKVETKPEAAKKEAAPEAKVETKPEAAKKEAAPEAKADGKPKPYVEKAPSKPEAKEGERAPQQRGPQSRGPGGPGGGRGPGGPGGGRGPGGPGGGRGPGGPGGNRSAGGHGGNRRGGRDQQQEPSEYTEKVVQVRRVTKVCKGGKKLSFRTTVIIGNEKGKVGVGVGKAAEVLIAIKKAIADARKKIVDISTVPNTNTISHTVTGIAGGSNVMLKPAADGTGIIAGGTARIVLELAGVGDILSKSKGSKSPLNVARATVNALKQLRSFQEVATLRGLSVKKILF
jgi:small subunit ribosomal protein S5